jgi:FkbM family methyltransferase
MEAIKNYFFFVLYIICNPQLVLVLFKGVYLPVYVQFKWLKKYKIKTIVDAGAHKGRVSQTLHLLFPEATIYAFEPNVSLHHEIKDKLKTSKLFLEEYALSDKPGEKVLYLANNSALTTTLPFLTPGVRDGLKVETIKQEIKSTTLDNYFRNVKTQGNIFLKIDIEGAEGLVLKGGEKFLNKVSIIHIETYFKQMYKGQLLFSEIYTFLESKGFKFAGIASESHFYPDFLPPKIVNSIFINPRLVRSS